MQPLLSASGWHGLTVMEERNDSTDFCSSYFSGDVRSDHHRSMGETHCYAGMCAPYMILVFGICMHSPSAIIETLNIHSIFSPGFWHTAGEASEASAGINWETIVFIAGMMIMVEGMGKAGFFRWLCLQIARLVHYKPIAVFVTFMIMSFVLAMFIDSITVILFLAAVTVNFVTLLKINPVPMIIAEIFCANLGGSATMCGDPPNIIIGTSMEFPLRFRDKHRCHRSNFTCAGCSLLLFLLPQRSLQNAGNS